MSINEQVIYNQCFFFILFSHSQLVTHNTLFKSLFSCVSVLCIITIFNNLSSISFNLYICNASFKNILDTTNNYKHDTE